MSTKDRGQSGDEQELLDFARVYLGEAFPNPERASCPPDHELRASATLPTQANPSIQEHLSCCSPCLTAYISHLKRAESERLQHQPARDNSRIRRFAVACAGATIVAVVLYVSTRERPAEQIAVAPHPSPQIIESADTAQTASSISVQIDLTNASPTRGPQKNKALLVPQPIPAASSVDLTVHLPVGSEERVYTVALSSKRRALWSESVRTHRKDGDTFFKVLADFSHIPEGNYDLHVSSPVTRLTVPVSILKISSTTPERKQP